MCASSAQSSPRSEVEAVSHRLFRHANHTQMSEPLTQRAHRWAQTLFEGAHHTGYAHSRRRTRRGSRRRTRRGSRRRGYRTRHKLSDDAPHETQLQNSKVIVQNTRRSLQRKLRHHQQCHRPPSGGGHPSHPPSALMQVFLVIYLLSSSSLHRLPSSGGARPQGARMARPQGARVARPQGTRRAAAISGRRRRHAGWRCLALAWPSAAARRR